MEIVGSSATIHSISRARRRCLARNNSKRGRKIFERIGRNGTYMTVTQIIARRSNHAPNDIHAESRLREDLGLSALDVVGAIIELEAEELGTDDFPLQLLQGVETVGDLAMVFDDWSAQRDTYENIDVSHIV
jgi:acyl carrier protein